LRSGGFFVNQFDNLNNMKAHYETTGPGTLAERSLPPPPPSVATHATPRVCTTWCLAEIWRDTAGRVDGLALSAGTGGTIAGCSHYLKVRCVIITAAASAM
jgi:cysteine synthase A